MKTEGILGERRSLIEEGKGMDGVNMVYTYHILGKNSITITPIFKTSK